MTEIYSGSIISTSTGDTDLVGWSTYSKWLLVDQMVTGLMTSRYIEK